MVHAKIHGKSSAIRIVSGAATAVLVTAGIVLLAPSKASAKAEFSAQTGLPCGQCHTSPGGGGKLKAFGEKFKANGYKVKK